MAVLLGARGQAMKPFLFVAMLVSFLSSAMAAGDVEVILVVEPGSHCTGGVELPLAGCVGRCALGCNTVSTDVTLTNPTNVHVGVTVVLP